ncbi:NHL repeat protein [Anatilimnocola aggregata]|uniref:NHL repeat protein n=2 Tax=Anatilimnocola aggregata TaxID=2528021 RepID=A0A517YK29_9BACT|nr:NHL repeat protein [Anatilimnocola aggregata]
MVAGCTPSGPAQGQLDAVWGNPGTGEGKLNHPRAICIDADNLLYIVDKTPRIQVFTPDGKLVRTWQTPEFQFGKPCGLSFDLEGNLLVADTHYYRILTYTKEGKLLAEKTIGGERGFTPGKFHFVTDCQQDAEGNYFIAEYGEFDRVQRFTRDRQFVSQWGGHGSDIGQFLRPQKMEFDRQGLLWITDACNHRLQVFDVSGPEPKLAKSWGEYGSGPGQLSYPYDLHLDEPAGHIYLCEFGNHRIQKFTLDGQYLGHWGRNGRQPGELDQPWGLTRDSYGRLYVIDTYNHRVQRFWL